MSAQSSRNTLLLLSAILALALGLRLYRVGTYGTYFDEKATLLVSQSVVMEGYNQKDVFSKKYFTPAEFWRPKTFNDFIEANIRSDLGNSPAYYGVLWLWLEVFGLSDESLRMPSVIFSTLFVWLLFVFIRRHFRFLGRQSADVLALTSAAIAAIEPFFVAYSHIARNYSMTFFLTLLATHLFLLIIERVRPDRVTLDRVTPDRVTPDRVTPDRVTPDQVRPPLAALGVTGSRRSLSNDSRAIQTRSLSWLYLAYGFVFVASVLSHYLTVTVFLCHGIYALLYLRNSRAWLTLGITSVVGLGLISLWFLFGGGKYTFFTLNYQANFYRNIALTNPTGSSYGLILPATLPNITKRAIPIFSDLFIVTNGLGAALMGLRNSTVALGLGTLATIVMHRYITVPKPPTWVYAAVPVLLVAGLPIYSVVPFRFLVLSVAIPFIYLIYRYVLERIDAQQRPLIVLLLLLAFIPTFFLLFMAWRGGHTFGITQRYSGFSFPYVCILVAMGLYQLVNIRWWFSLPIAIALLIQGAHIVQLLGDIYADKAPKYTYFDKTRIANPYWSSAQQLIRQYAPGDTILYPNKVRVIESEEMDKTYTPLSLLDAQLINVYLPEDAQYIQRIDPNERDRIVLVKGQSGKKITIFDFKGKAYRYGE